MKILIVSNTAWSLVNFRLGLIQTLLDHGHEVVAIAPPDKHASNLSDIGIKFIGLPMDNNGTNPVKDLRLFFAFLRLLRRERPGLLLSYTIKPVIYGSLAARFLAVPAISVITGLGTVYLEDTWVKNIVNQMYRIATARLKALCFINSDDRTMFLERGLARPEIVHSLPGEGIDLRHFVPVKPVPSASGKPFRFLLMARMLRDKGVGEFVEAARAIRARRADVEFDLLGFIDERNPAGITAGQIRVWTDEGVVNYLGETNDVRPYLAVSDCIVLPSYREGIPRVLLEASAMGRPIIATNVPGCRNVVDEGVTGFLCRPRDPLDLERALVRLLELPSAERAEMGRQGRVKVEREFDEKIVIGKYLKLIEDMD